MLLFLFLACKDKGTDDSSPPTDDSSAVIPEDCTAVAGNICTWAGTPQVAAFDGDAHHRLLSYFYWPMDIEFSPYGPPVVNDWNNHKIRILHDDQTFETVIGTNFIGDGDPDLQDRVYPGVPGTTVSLNHPTDATWYPDGRLLSAGWHTFKFRTWDPATKLAYVYWGDGPGFVGDGFSDATGGKDNFLKSLVLVGNGDIYFLDEKNQRIRLLTSDYTIGTIAGTGTAGFSGDGGQATEAQLNFPRDLEVDSDGTIFVADTDNHAVRAIAPDGTIRTIAGTGTSGFSGDDGPAASAQLYRPFGVSLGQDGNLYIADTYNQVIRVVYGALAQ